MSSINMWVPHVYCGYCGKVMYAGTGIDICDDCRKILNA